MHTMQLYRPTQLIRECDLRIFCCTSEDLTTDRSKVPEECEWKEVKRKKPHKSPDKVEQYLKFFLVCGKNQFMYCSDYCALVEFFLTQF